jgi:endoglucanase Acf2
MTTLFIICIIVIGNLFVTDARWYTPSQLDPLSSTDPIHDLGISSVSRTHGLPNPLLFGSTRGPLPTNKWFMNAVLGTGSGSENTIITLPMIHQATSSIITYYPNVLVHGNGQYQNVWDPVVGGISLGSSETDNEGTTHKLMSYDELSASLLWSPSHANGGMQSILVRGSPYTSMSYALLTPLVATRQSLVRLW